MNDREVVIGAARMRSLLGLLLLQRGETLLTETAIELLWHGAPPAGARVTFRTYISGLRRIFRDAEAPDPIVTRPGGYAAVIGDAQLDAEEFERAIAGARRDLSRQLYEEAADAYAAALALWRGNVLHDAGLSAVDVPEIGRLEEGRLVAVEEGNEAALLCGRHERLLAPLSVMCREHPFRERLWSQWIRALYAVGRQAEALRAFSELRSVLGEELGIEPSQQLRDLETAMLLQRPELERRHPIDLMPSTRSADQAVLATSPADTVRLLATYTSAATLHEADDVALVSFTEPTDALRAAVSLHIDSDAPRRTVVHCGALEGGVESALPLAAVEARNVLTRLAPGALALTRQAADATHALPAGCSLGNPASVRVRGTTRAIELQALSHPELAAPDAVVDDATTAGLLPMTATSFVGRTREIEQVLDLVRLGGLTTLSGPGGIGKSRVAVEVAVRLAGAFADGVWFADLATVTEPDEVHDVLASALGLPEGELASLDAIAARIGEDAMLLLLDNCEQVRDSVATIVDALNNRCAGLRVLATSRLRLGLDHESVWPIGPLELVVEPTTTALSDVEACDAVRLFCERARAVSPAFALDAANVADVVRLCDGVDALPLALELAAARVRVATPGQIADRLTHAMRLLADDAASGRHPSVVAALEWSYELLTPGDQRLLARLGVFSGSFNLEACEALAALDGLDEVATLDALGRLAEHSLLSVLPERSPRYRLLQMTRGFALERLASFGGDEVRRTRDTLAEWVRAFVRTTAPKLNDANQFAALESLETEFANIATALDHSLHDGDISTGVDSADVLERYWHFANRTAYARRYWAEALELVSDPLDRLKALLGTARLALSHGELETGARVADRALPLARAHAPEMLAETLTMLATASVRLGRMETAARCFADALDAARASGSERALDAALHNLGTFNSQIGNVDLAADYYEQSLELARRRGDNYNQAITLSNLGGLATLTGKSGAALEYLREASDAIEGLADRRIEAIVLTEFGNAYIADADYDAARESWTDALAASIDAGDQGLIAVTTCGLGLVAAQTADRRAKRLLREARQLAATLGLVEVVAEADVGLALADLNDGAAPAAAARLAAAGAAAAARVQLRQAIAGVDVVARALIAAQQYDLARRVMHAADYALTNSGYNRNDKMIEVWSGLWSSLAAAGFVPEDGAVSEDLLSVLEEIKTG